MKQNLPKVFMGCLGVVITLTLVLCVAGYMQTTDEPHYDDSRLMPVLDTEPLPDEENALTYFIEAGEKLQVSDEEQKHLGDIYNQNKCFDDAEESFIRGILAKNKETLALFQKGAAQSRLKYPEAVIPKTLAEWENLPYTKFSPISSATRLPALQAALAVKHNETGQARKSLESIFRAGHLIGRDTLIAVAVAMAADEQAFNAWQKLLAGDAGQEEETARSWTRIKPMLLSRQTMVNTIKLAYAQRLPFWTEPYEQGEREGVREMTGASEDSPLAKGAYFAYRLSPLRGYLYQPNRTKHLAALCHEDMVKDIQTLGNNTDRKCPDTFFNKDNVLAPNLMGRLLLQTGMPRFAQISRQIGKYESRIQLLDTMLALRQYQRDHDNQLPPDLGALVPRYLAAPSTNPFNNEPLDYDAQTGSLSITLPQQNDFYTGKEIESKTLGVNVKTGDSF